MMWKGVPLLVSICLLCCQAALGHDKYAYIAFVNDVHNRIEEEDPTTSTPCSAKARAAGTCVGGWPRISSAVKSLRLQAQKEGSAFFFLDAGDEFTGTMWDAVYQGQTVAPLLLNKVKPDVMVSGRPNTAAAAWYTMLQTLRRNFDQQCTGAAWLLYPAIWHCDGP